MHTVLRLTYGPTPNLVDHVRRVGTAAFLEEQLAARTPPDVTKGYDLLGLRAEDVDISDQTQRADGVVQFQMSTVWRQAASPARLRASASAGSRVCALDSKFSWACCWPCPRRFW